MKHVVIYLALLILVACSRGGSTAGDGGTTHDSAVGIPGCDPSRDMDGDGIADVADGMLDIDGDGMPNEQDSDSDNDGIPDTEEHGSSNPCIIADCDSDGTPNFLDTDSDNDGVSDHDERFMFHTDPCLKDTDGDGAYDLAEITAGTSPTDSTSRIPDTDFFVVLPYMGDHVPKVLRFGTNIQKADIYFLVDTTGSMQPAIDNVRTSLTNIATRIRAAIPDVQMGVGRLEDFPFSDSSPFGMTFYGSTTDVPYQNFQDITDDVTAVSTALGALNIGDGHDGPESQVEALYQTATGEGADWTTTIMGGGLLGGLMSYSLPPKVCGSIPDETGMRRGYPCFRPESLPIVVLVTDIEWHNGSADGTRWPYSMITPAPHTLPQAAEALYNIGGRYIGIAVGDSDPVAYWRTDHEAVATMTGSLDASGAPLVYNAMTGEVSDSIITGLETLALHTPQDVTTRTENYSGNPGGVDATMFIKSIVPLEGYDSLGTAGAGYTSKDLTTFYGVTPGTQVEFTIDFYNDFVMPPATAQIYRARIIVIGNRSARLSERNVYIIVPPDHVTILI